MSEYPSTAAAAAAFVPVHEVDDDEYDDVIDLTSANEAAALETFADGYAKEASKGFGHSSRKKSKKRTRSSFGPVPKDVDAIAVDDEDKKQSAETDGKNTKKSDENLYRQVLGPLRMDFIDSFATEHNADYQSYRYYGGGVPKSNGQAANKMKTKPVIMKQTNLQRLYKELVEYNLNLPVAEHSAIFCRVLESDLCTLRVMLTGPLDTPYAAGCFFFDILLPDYPHKPPKVRLLTTGGGKVRFNPNLYQDGKVCLSLLGKFPVFRFPSC